MSAVAPGRGREPTTVVLVGRHGVIRAGLRLLLEREDDLAVLGEARDLAAAERLLARTQPQVLVLDAAAPGGPDPVALARVAAARPSPPVLVVLGAGEADADGAALVRAVRGAAAGRRAGGRRERRLGAGARRPATPGPRTEPGDGASPIGAASVGRGRGPDELSAREAEVLGLIALGHTNGEIAERLYLSVRTIETHRAHIQQKTRRSTRAELVAYAREHGL